VYSAKGKIQYVICTKYTLEEKPSPRDKLILSSERILHKEYYRKSSIGKKFLVVGLKGPGTKTN
jgi:hypothetical protein